VTNLEHAEKKQRAIATTMNDHYGLNGLPCMSVIAPLLNTDKGSFLLLQSLKNLLHAFVVDTQ
jgi:hypothetical protein